jgi:hypothetical protein
MSRRGADEISGSPELQARISTRPAATMSADQRDRLIVHLDGLGWNHTKIGHAVGLTRRGVGMALERIREGRPGRVRGE